MVLDDDDPDLADYQSAIGRLFTNFPVHFEVGPRLRLAGSLNSVCRRTAQNYKIVGFMGDDHRPRSHGWDARFVECLSGGGPGLVYGNDLLVGAAFPTAVAMTSDIPQALGYLCPPGLTHLNLDLVWRDWGQAINRITYLPDVIIEHVHPAANKAAVDDRYEEVNSREMVSADGLAYEAYKAGPFKIDAEKLRALL